MAPSRFPSLRRREALLILPPSSGQGKPPWSPQPLSEAVAWSRQAQVTAKGSQPVFLPLPAAFSISQGCAVPPRLHPTDGSSSRKPGRNRILLNFLTCSVACVCWSDPRGARQTAGLDCRTAKNPSRKGVGCSVCIHKSPLCVNRTGLLRRR